MKIFIELWKAKDAWRELAKEDRQNYMAQIGPVMEDLISRGLVIEAWGMNTDKTKQKSEYDFFAVSKLPSDELLKEFEAIVEGAGWYNYFKQVNVSGNITSPDEVIGKMLEL